MSSFSKPLARRIVIAGLPASLLLSASPARAGQGQIGLIFVGAGSCPYCQVLGPVLHDLHVSTDVEVLLASMDNSPVLPFHSFEDGLSHPLTRHFTSVPQVMVYNRDLDEITHVVGGLRTMRRFVLRLSHAIRESAAL